MLFVGLKDSFDFLNDTEEQNQELLDVLQDEDDEKKKPKKAVKKNAALDDSDDEENESESDDDDDDDEKPGVSNGHGKVVNFEDDKKSNKHFSKFLKIKYF